MKKLIAIITACFLVLSSLTAFSAGTLELDPLMYDVYLRGETVHVSGTSSVFVTLGLYTPQEEGGMLRMSTILSPSNLAEGFDIETGTDEDRWPEGTWKIIVQNGDLREELEFELLETVDRTPEDKPTEEKPTSGSNTVPTVNIIKLDPSTIEIEVGQKGTVSVESSASSLSAEAEYPDIVSASISGGKLTVTALKTGTSAIWVRSSNNYAVLNVTVIPATEEATEKPTEEPTEAPTEEPTQAPTINVSFNDIDSHWAKDDILYLAERGIISGFGDDTFRPELNVTRAQFVTMLKNAFGITRTTESEVFADVKASAWYYESVMAAFDAGIANGGQDGNFNPDAQVTRQDMAVFAYRMAQYNSHTFPEYEKKLFADDEEISSYAKDAVYALQSEGVINGMGEGFLPRGTATRAQAATIIAKLYRLMK